MDVSFLEKKAVGRHIPLFSCSSAARHSCVRGVDHDALRDARLGVCEECGISETFLDPLKSCCRVVGVKGMQDGRALGNKAPIKVHQPKKLAELTPRVWLGKL